MENSSEKSKTVQQVTSNKGGLRTMPFIIGDLEHLLLYKNIYIYIA